MHCAVTQDKIYRMAWVFFIGDAAFFGDAAGLPIFFLTWRFPGARNRSSSTARAEWWAGLRARQASQSVRPNVDQI